MVNHEKLYTILFNAALKACNELGDDIYKLEWLYKNQKNSEYTESEYKQAA